VHQKLILIFGIACVVSADFGHLHLNQNGLSSFGYFNTTLLRKKYWIFLDALVTLPPIIF